MLYRFLSPNTKFLIALVGIVALCLIAWPLAEVNERTPPEDALKLLTSMGLLLVPAGIIIIVIAFLPEIKKARGSKWHTPNRLSEYSDHHDNN